MTLGRSAACAPQRQASANRTGPRTRREEPELIAQLLAKVRLAKAAISSPRQGTKRSRPSSHQNASLDERARDSRWSGSKDDQFFPSAMRNPPTLASWRATGDTVSDLGGRRFS